MRHCLICFALVALINVGLAAADPLEALISARVMTLPPDLPRTKVYPEGVVASGDLFKSGKRTAIALAVRDGQSLGFACFVHKNGDWREIARQSLVDGNQHVGADDDKPFAFVDVDGDTKPELLLTEHGGADDRVVQVYRFDGETDTLSAAGGGLRNPTWQDGAVRGQWKLGPTAGDIGAEQHRWVDGRLQLMWRSSQRYPMHEYLIGGGEPAVRTLLDLSDAAGVISSTSAVGNLASYRNRLPAGEQPRPFQVLVRETKGRRLIEVSPKSDGLRTTKHQQHWDDIVSRAVFTDPAAFSGDMTVTLGDHTAVTLTDVATVTVLPSTIAPTYQFLPVSDEVRRTIEEPGTLPALAAANAGTTDWTRMDDAARAWAAAAAANVPLATTDDTLVFLRLPNITGYPLDQIEAGTLVSALTLTDKVVQVTLTITPGQKPSLPSKIVARPLIGVSLGRLAKGAYRINATISGHPNGALKVEYVFTVQ